MKLRFHNGLKDSKKIPATYLVALMQDIVTTKVLT